jgi:hypothetical protein
MVTFRQDMAMSPQSEFAVKSFAADICNLELNGA